MNKNHEFDALKAALQNAPAPSPNARSAALDRALQAFDERQGAAQENDHALRPNQDRPQKAGLMKGFVAMLSTLKLRPVLAATTSIAALGLAVFVVLPNLPMKDLRQPPIASRESTSADTGVAVTPQSTVAQPAAPALARKAAPLADVAPAPVAEAEFLSQSAPMIALTAGAFPEPMPEIIAESTETFANADAQPVKATAEEPVSTFSIDVDTASYAVIRNSLNAGFLPAPDAVRIEEMVNYFPYAYPAPEAAKDAFRPSVAVFPTPWNENTRLVRIALQGRLPERAERPPLNLVLLIDTSGSMQDAAKLPLLKQSLGLMLAELRPEDQVAIVAYAGSAGEVLPPTPASDRAAILAAMDRLQAGGATAGAEGLELAYQTAEKMNPEGMVNRVLLATDGDFNLGISDPEALKTYIAAKRGGGTYLSVLGFGRGNLDDATMQALAQSGNGTASYIDTLQEARKVLVDQLSGALFPIADDVKIQVEWNPAEVAEYRLIGYETRALRREDFSNDKVDAGEIGAGHQVTALYEITAPDSPALRNDPLRYGTRPAVSSPAQTAPELGFLRLRYKAPGAATSTLMETPITAENGGDDDARFAAAIAGFGQLLRGSTYLGDWGWDQAIALASANRGADEFGYRVEAVNLMRLARDLAK